MADNVKANPQTLEQVGLVLKSKIQDVKLVIQGFTTKDGTQYIGQLKNNINEYQLEDIEVLIQNNKVKVFPISDNLIKIKVGGTPIQLISKPKNQNQNRKDTETIKKLLKTQSFMEKQIQQHNDELLQHKTLINELQMNLNGLKLMVKLEMSSYGSLKEAVANFRSQTQKRLIESESTIETKCKEFQQLVKIKKQPQKNDTLDEDKIQEMKKQINQLKDQITQLKLNQEDKISNFLKVEQVSQSDKPDSSEKIQQNAKIKQLFNQDFKKVLDQKFESFHLRLDANENVIDHLKNQIKKLEKELEKTVSEQSEQLKEHESRFIKTSILLSQHAEQLKKNESQLKKIQTSLFKHNEQLKMHENKTTLSQAKVNQYGQQLKKHANEIEKTSTTVSQHSEHLQQHQNRIHLIISYLQQKSVSPLQKLQFSLIYSRLNEPIRSSKWSEQLKSKAITINNNVVTRITQYNGYQEFTLLDASFSNKIKQKQSWTFKINKKTDWIFLGVCLKSQLLKHIFNSQNMKWSEKGHGLYMICSYGLCWSHSQEEFNHVEKIFKFDENDLILIEYDPIDNKLKFSKNKESYFELSITTPLQNDAYHPFVSLGGQNSSVELIQP